MDVIFERQYHALKRALELGYGPTFRLIGAEYATQPYLPTEYFDELIVKYEKQFIDLIHNYNCFARIHCHGRVKEALPLMIKAGADGTDPIEAPPSGDIELAEAKKLYGKELCLFGNIQLKDLEYASPSQIDEIVKKAMDSAKDGGGYVLMPTASPINIPLSPQTEANYFQMIDSALKYGRY